jgi:hypothetical protein
MVFNEQVAGRKGAQRWSNKKLVDKDRGYTIEE